MSIVWSILQELERKDKDSNQLSTQPTQNFVVETASAEQALPPSLPTGHQGSEFRIRNEKSMIELGKLPESPSGRGPQTGRSIHVNLLVDRKSRQSQQQRPTTKVDGEKLGLLYTIHENKGRRIQKSGTGSPTAGTDSAVANQVSHFSECSANPGNHRQACRSSPRAFVAEV